MLDQPALFGLLALEVAISDPCELRSKLLLNANLLHILLYLAHELIDWNDGQKAAGFEVSQQRESDNDARLILLIIRYQEIPDPVGKLRGKSGEEIEQMLRNEAFQSNIASVQVVIEVGQFLLDQPSEYIEIGFEVGIV